MGLRYNEKYKTIEDLKTLRYGKLMIMTDQDQVWNWLLCEMCIRDRIHLLKNECRVFQYILNRYWRVRKYSNRFGEINDRMKSIRTDRRTEKKLTKRWWIGRIDERHNQWKEIIIKGLSPYMNVKMIPKKITYIRTLRRKKVNSRGELLQINLCTNAQTFELLSTSF